MSVLESLLGPNNLPWCEQTTCYLSIHLLVFRVFTLFGCSKRHCCAHSHTCGFLCGPVFMSVGVCLGAELLSQEVTADLFQELPACFPKALGRSTFPSRGGLPCFFSVFKFCWSEAGLQCHLRFGRIAEPVGCAYTCTHSFLGFWHPRGHRVAS